MSGDIIQGRLLNQTTYRAWNKVLVRSLSKLAHLSSQEATSFHSSLMFRLFFLAYLRIENIFFSGFFHISSLVSSCFTLFARIGMQNDVMSLGKSLMIYARWFLLPLKILYKQLSFSRYDKNPIGKMSKKSGPYLETG